MRRMAQGRQWHKLPDVEKSSTHLCSAPARLLPHSLPSPLTPPMSHPTAHNDARSQHPHSVDVVRAAHHGSQEPFSNLRSHARHDSDSFSSAHVCDAREARNGAHEPTTQLQATRIDVDLSFNANGNARCLPTKSDQRWVSDMDEYLAASRLCREEAMTCSLLAAGVQWPSAERENRKKNKNKSLSLTCRALNAGTNRSWRGLKKLLSKQFMPFSNRDHHGLHHINTSINKRSLKTLNVGGRKMDARIQDGANKRDFILGCRELQGKENVEQNGNEIRLPFSIDVETCRSQLGSWEKNCKLQKGKLKEGGFKNRVHILLSKASDVALEVCDILNLE